jgi:ubiquinone/menaquinone biosynthesis C-methylase UbiE
MKQELEDVREYWDSHLNLTQFLPSEDIEIGSDAFWSHLEGSMDRYAYKQAVLERFAASCGGGGKLLEIGCGLGLELARLGELGFDVTGADLAPNAVELCNAYLRRKGLSGHAEVQNAESLTFPDESFDAVYSSGVIQHTPSIEKAIAEIWRVLRPGGRILVILYHRHSWFHLLQSLSGTNVEFESGDAPIVNSYTRNELRQLFSRFRDLEVETEYYHPKPTRRPGAAAVHYNRVFVPVMGALPASAVRRFGWHLVLTGRK